MKYFYNYSFLDKWMEANGDITNKQIMKALGTTSNTCLDSWVQMKSPLPTIALLRFCNAFHVPLSAFIVDADSQMEEGDDGMEHVRPGIDDQFEPDGGYIDNDEKRKLGTRALRNPLDVDRIKSVVPGLTSDEIAGKGGDPERRHGRKEEHSEAAASAPMNENVAMLPAAGAEPDISMTTLNRMLDIIAEQQKQIGDQQKLISELTRRLESQQPSYNMVAEEIHREK
nr:MAG TPA: helix-turn-helix domain protein [Caudoviricetes sp.]